MDGMDEASFERYVKCFNPFQNEPCEKPRVVSEAHVGFYGLGFDRTQV